MIEIIRPCFDSFEILPTNLASVDLVRPAISRRTFLKAVPGFSAAIFETHAGSRQLFQAGVIPVGKTTVEHGREEVLDYCDEITRLGFHRFEVDNTRAHR